MIVYKDEIEIGIAALPVIWGLWKFVIKPSWKNLRESLTALRSIHTLHVAVDKLHSDLRPNGGSSLRDAVDRVEKMVTSTNTAQKAIMDLLSAGFFLTDATGDCIHVNRYWQQLTGIPLEEALGSGWMACLHPDDRDRVTSGWLTAAADGRVFTDNFRIINKGTNRVYRVNCHSIPLRDGSGHVYGHIGTIVDRAGENL